GVSLLEPTSVVCHTHPNRIAAVTKLNRESRGGGVSDGVGDGFLADAKQLLFHIVRLRPSFADDLQAELHGGASSQSLAGILKRRRQPGAVEVVRAQVPDG